MRLAKLLYIDEHGVSLTKYRLRVKKQTYAINEIRGHQLHVMRPERAPGFFLLIIGLGLIMCSAVAPVLLSIPESIEKFVSPGAMIFYSGMLLIFWGLARIVLSRERYALRIYTKQGDKNAIVSTRKEYIDEINSALNNVFGLNEYAKN